MTAQPETALVSVKITCQDCPEIQYLEDVPERSPGIPDENAVRSTASAVFGWVGEHGYFWCPDCYQQDAGQRRFLNGTLLYGADELGLEPPK